MPLIDNFDLPEPFALELKEFVNTLSPDRVLEFAKAQPSWFRGLRVIKKRSGLLKQRMAKMMLSPGKEIPGELLKFIASNTLNRNLISKLPLESLTLFLSEFQKIFGSRQFLICLLLDDREEIQHFARQEIKNFHEQDTGSHKESDQTDSPINQQQKEQIEQLERELTRLKNEAAVRAKKNNRLSKKISKAKDTLASQQQLTAEYKERGDQYQQLSVRLQARLDRLAAEVEDTIQQGVAAEMAAVVSNWLAVPGEIDALANRDTTDSLLTRVERALERQAQTDKHSGNLRILKKRLASLERARESVEQSRRDALQVIPELAQLSRELDGEIQQILAKIGPFQPTNSYLAPWLAAVNEASSAETLQELDRLIGQVRRQSLLSEQNVLLLQEKIRQVRDQRIDHFTYVEEKEQPCSLCQTLIVDGHNVILGSDSLYLFACQDCQQDEQEKRQQLIGMPLNAFADKENISVVIFFDSPIYSNTKIASNITEIYSGGGNEDQRADNAIIDFLQSRHEQYDAAGNRCCLITNDQELSTRAGQLGVTSRSVFEYSVMLRYKHTGIPAA